MNIIEWIGAIAAICTTSAFIPQVIQVVRTKNTKSIALGMYLLFVIGVSLWLIYGILIHAYPIIFANLITLILASIILGYKIKFK